MFACLLGTFFLFHAITARVLNITDEFDYMIGVMNQKIRHLGYQEVQVPPLKVAGVAIVGSTLRGLDTNERKGDALVTFNDTDHSMTAHLGFGQRGLELDFELRSGLGGRLTAADTLFRLAITARNMTFGCHVVLDNFGYERLTDLRLSTSLLSDWPLPERLVTSLLLPAVNQLIAAQKPLIEHQLFSLVCRGPNQDD